MLLDIRFIAELPVQHLIYVEAQPTAAIAALLANPVFVCRLIGACWPWRDWTRRV
ncbi:MAG: hypothetical protein R3D52_02775 [Xanthobacteraceae bacterium]